MGAFWGMMVPSTEITASMISRITLSLIEVKNCMSTLKKLPMGHHLLYRL